MRLWCPATSFQKELRNVQKSLGTQTLIWNCTSDKRVFVDSRLLGFLSVSLKHYKDSWLDDLFFTRVSSSLPDLGICWIIFEPCFEWDNCRTCHSDPGDNAFLWTKQIPWRASRCLCLASLDQAFMQSESSDWFVFWLHRSNSTRSTFWVNKVCFGLPLPVRSPERPDETVLLCVRAIALVTA